ncbi:MAG TPA: DUF4394 domain-containing protein [Phycisphaerae bacterium]|jgi:hypothetical protein|nr:DUF4394 domain-containing protein [Phycisphaerae bacterium]
MLKKHLIAAGVALAAVVAARSANAELIYGLNGSGTNIFSFDSTNTGKIISGKFITGMAANEQMLTIDARPSTGGIYAVGSFGNLYTLNPGTGAATLVAPITGASVDGTNFGSDFNPLSSGFSASGDTLQFSSDTGVNWRINPVTGVATVQSTLAFGAGDAHAGGNVNLVGLAYTNNFTGATTTQLFGIDSGFDALVSLATPSSGSITTIGALGINATDLAGFDISGSSGTAYAALQTTTSGISNLYTINLTTGTATLVGQIGGGLLVRDITVIPGGGAGVPEPASLGLLAIGAAAMFTRRRRKV